MGWVGLSWLGEKMRRYNRIDDDVVTSVLRNRIRDVFCLLWGSA